MPSSASKQGRQSIFGTLKLVLAAVIVCALVTQSQVWAFEVKGRELPWSISVPDKVAGWVGGSYYQIETIFQHTGDESIKGILSWLKEAAKNKEAALIHLEDAYLAAQRDASFSTRTLTEIVVILQQKRNPTTASEWQKLWEGFLAVLPDEYPGSKVTLVEQDSFQVGQGYAVEAVFRVRQSTGGTLYETWTIVPLSPSGRLAFRLRADSSRHSQRRASMRQMVQSLRFH